MSNGTEKTDKLEYLDVLLIKRTAYRRGTLTDFLDFKRTNSIHYRECIQTSNKLGAELSYISCRSSIFPAYSIASDWPFISDIFIAGVAMPSLVSGSVSFELVEFYFCFQNRNSYIKHNSYKSRWLDYYQSCHRAVRINISFCFDSCLSNHEWITSDREMRGVCSFV